MQVREGCLLQLVAATDGSLPESADIHFQVRVGREKVGEFLRLICARQFSVAGLKGQRRRQLSESRANHFLRACEQDMPAPERDDDQGGDDDEANQFLHKTTLPTMRSRSVRPCT